MKRLRFQVQQSQYRVFVWLKRLETSSLTQGLQKSFPPSLVLLVRQGVETKEIEPPLSMGNSLRVLKPWLGGKEYFELLATQNLDKMACQVLVTTHALNARVRKQFP